MRQLLIQVPVGQGQRVLDAAERHGGRAMGRLPAEEDDRAAELVVAFVPNDHVEAVLAELQDIEGRRVALEPHGTLVLEGPADQVADHLAAVQPRSPIEVYLSARQSVGSWRSFLAYAAAAGVLAWVGLYTDTVFLLTAAMLVAPFASPAMNLAIATARGDGELMLRSVGRYVTSLGVAIAVAALLSWLVGLTSANSLTQAVANVSSTAVLLPLVAGAAGALSQVQSERASLVSGAAVGLLVAASLAPPAALIGMALVLGDWRMVVAGAFLLVLQLAGINVTGALVFRIYGLGPRGVRYNRGRHGVQIAGAVLSAGLLAGLLAWQFSSPVALREASSAQRAEALVQRTVADSGLADVIEIRSRYPRARVAGRPVLLVELTVASHKPGATAALAEGLTSVIQARIQAQGWGVTPLVHVTVLAPP